MDHKQIQSILASDSFKQLVSRRWAVALVLTVLVLAIYFGFILVLAFDKAVLAQKIGDHLTLGIPVGIGIIVASWILTGIYVRWANATYDSEVSKLKEQAGR